MITFKGFAYKFQIFRTARKKTVSISIKNKLVIISVPDFLSNTRVLDIIESKADWIKKKIEEDSKKPRFLKRRFKNGDFFYFLGQPKKLLLIKSRKNYVKILTEYLVVNYKNNQQNLKKIITDWYLNEAQKYLFRRTLNISKKMGIKFTSINIKTFKRRLGSCDKKANLCYNWKIIMAEKCIIDYIIIHELSHIIHFNHSNSFWKYVEKFCPDYKKSKLWLNKNHEIFNFN